MKEIGSIPAFIIDFDSHNSNNDIVSIQLTPYDIRYIIRDFVLLAEKSTDFNEQKWYHRIVNTLNDHNSEYVRHKLGQ